MARDRIVSFRFDEVVVPAHADVINSKGLDKPLHMLPVKGKPDWSTQFDELSKVVMRMQLKGGIVALGEFYRGHSWDVLEDVAGKLIGQRISQLSRQALPIALCREYDGFECAIWDAAAKLMDVPLHQLLGGAVRDRVHVGAWSSHRTVEEIGPWARQYADRGYGCIKLKTDLEDDCIGWSEQIARHAPGMKIILDPNQRWENLGEAKRIARELEKIGNVLLLEDPIPRWMLQDYERLRSITAIPVFLHVSLPYVYQGQRVYEAVNALMHGAVDGFNFNAGLAKFQQLTHIAHAANLSCWHGSEIDLGILEAMYVHQAASAVSCTLPSDIFGRLIRKHDLLKQPLNFNPPFVDVPQAPGLGVELDDAAVEEFSVAGRSVTD
ncbi:mandelate racemase/muconate lactonizing enzyme family protein [Hoeflea sp. TYP-13]|uniref:mandelate racemase/muconate lactonizing enzyme family protein n=1 Tax=Hoeflea sp. TYP-13 TaxID=3230023 RepID=UPI0034C6D2B7